MNKAITLFFMGFASAKAFAVPLDTIGTFCTTFPDQCRKGTTSLLAARGSGTNDYYVMEVDPTSGAVPVSGSFSFTDPAEGTPGSGAPAKAIQIGGSDGTNLRAIKTATDGTVKVDAYAAVTNAIVASNDDSSNNITTGAYVQLIASTANAITTLCVSDSSGQIIKVATGAAASEVDRIYLPAGGSGCFRLNVPASTRVSLKALNADATSGYFVLTGY